MPEPLDGFLLAAGLGLRMGPLSCCLPKPAWTLRDRPLLQWGADAMRRAGLTRLGCNAHLHVERLRAVAEGIEVCEEPHLLGSAGGLRHALGRVEAELLTWNADVWAETVPFDRLREAHRSARATLSWLLIPHPGGRWNPVWMDERNRILPKGVVGPQGPFHFTGAAAWSPEALALLPEGPSEVNEVLRPRLAGTPGGHLGVVVDPFAWREVGTPEALIEAAAALAPLQEGRLPGCYVHPGAHPSGRLTACILGPEAAPPPALTDHHALWFEEGGSQVRLGLP
ncbi:NTP transferase domain-containing protein [Geothrix sp. PMB-07]|uniref:NTP transferase domain-containing protein n=1 Tax=Geothrix sp. PMB-07 TaxID=3068640 RepID=UPI002740FCF2|nr:NTP transferase domain-containing protein [Geothrix sp. PMB-07]WLT31595.1 NTP transferase domain-containing protein [Geothrix sp. PMB-07]